MTLSGLRGDKVVKPRRLTRVHVVAFVQGDVFRPREHLEIVEAVRITALIQGHHMVDFEPTRTAR